MKTFRPYLSWIPFTFLLLLAQFASAQGKKKQIAFDGRSLLVPDENKCT